MTEPTATRHRLAYFGHPEPHVPGHELSETPSPPIRRRTLAMLVMIGFAVAYLGFLAHHWSMGSIQPTVAPWLIAPFALLLLSIATMPFVAPHWWEHNYAKVAIALGVLVAGYYLLFVGNGLGPRAVAAASAEYISFIFLLGSLFIVSGGILIRVRANATPLANVTLLFIGAVLANVFGTTGASMLLIRPFLRMNRGHIRPFHVVFFIFVVSNAGGSLTPIGDPPLFLGYLQGVPFWWVAEHCWPFWLLVNGGLLVIFFVLDTLHSRKATREGFQGEAGPAISLYGAGNLAWIALILGGILLHDPLNHQLRAAANVELPIREWAMTVAAVMSLRTTPRRVHEENHFNYAPIKEVAFLFVGIFLTMMPALHVLAAARRQTTLTPSRGQLYFTSGALSAVLDNAPTYLVFLQSIPRPWPDADLMAVSMGAVLFGAMTYIGNGPNFMVRSVATHAGVEMPSFFGYVFRYSIPVLLPLLVVAWALWLR